MKTPKGFVQLDVEVWTDGVRLFICGDAPDEFDDPECEAHHCDSMGCGVQHILWRGLIDHRQAIALGYKAPIEVEAAPTPRERAMQKQREAGNDLIYLQPRD